jgi:hypothetical protein
MCSDCLLHTPASPSAGAGRAAGSRAVTWSRSADASGMARSGSQQERPLAAQISATWAPGQNEPWIVVSDRPAGRQRVREYARRMRVESTFQDLKRRGWDLEGTVVTDRARLDRLLLVVFLGLWWLAHLAASCVHHGQRARFDRHDRRDKGIFRLGRLWLLDILRRTATPTSLSHCLPFRKTPTGWAFSLRF